MYRHTLAYVAGLLLFTQVAAGQLIQFGPQGGVRVNAPFVRVEVGPTGETYVRAPFTSVYAPGRPFYEPFHGGAVYERPLYDHTPHERRVNERPIFQGPLLEPRYRADSPRPAAPIPNERLAQMSWRDLRSYLRDAASQLDAELDRLADGDIWRNYLQPQSILALAAEDTDRIPTPIEIEQFKILRRTFEGTVANRQLQRIASLPGFDAVREGLRQMTVTSQAPSVSQAPIDASAVANPRTSLDDRREQLAASAMELDRDLRRFQLSALRGYLELPVAIYAGGGTADATAPDAEEFELVLRRYDGVSRSSDHEKISSLQSFRDTQRLLSEYVRDLRAPPHDPEPTPAEPLPLPEPLPRR